MNKALILAYALASMAIGQPSGPRPDPTIRLDVNLILANATVLDGSGRSVSDLDQQAFRLFVDGNPQQITLFRREDAPVTVGIIVDNSASMTSKGQQVLSASLAFARASNPQDQMFVVHFSDQARLGLPPEIPFTGSTAELEKALSGFNPSGTTALYDALATGFSHMQKSTIEKRVLFVISDGGDNSSHTRLDDVLRLARQFGYTIYCIGIYDSADRDSNPEVLRNLAELTGGKAYFPQDLEEVTGLSVEIAREIRKQYTLGFVGQEDGHYHHISITAQDPHRSELTVRTRAGYYGPVGSGIGIEGQ